MRKEPVYYSVAPNHEDIFELDVGSHQYLFYQIFFRLAAEDYYDNHDGWEDPTWRNGNPIMFKLYENGQNLPATHEALVNLEWTPHYALSNIMDLENEKRIKP